MWPLQWVFNLDVDKERGPRERRRVQTRGPPIWLTWPWSRNCRPKKPTRWKTGPSERRVLPGKDFLALCRRSALTVPAWTGTPAFEVPLTPKGRCLWRKAGRSTDGNGQAPPGWPGWRSSSGRSALPKPVKAAVDQPPGGGSKIWLSTIRATSPLPVTCPCF